jgi:hypothetical protein
MLQGKNLSSKGAEFKIILPLFDPSRITIEEDLKPRKGSE